MQVLSWWSFQFLKQMNENRLHTRPSLQESDYHTSVQVNLPNARKVLVLGVLSIVFSSWYFAIIGVILSLRALVLANHDLAHYSAGKSQYSLSSYNNLKAGRVCAMIGLSVSILFCILFLLILLGIFSTWPFWGMVD
jgi:hypothetical protein